MPCGHESRTSRVRRARRRARSAYESFGDGDTTVVFPPVDLIVDSALWKAQVPYLARHFRVVTIDPRGNGAVGPADRPGGVRRPRVRRRHHRRDGRARHRPGRAGRHLLRRLAGAHLRLTASRPGVGRRGDRALGQGPDASPADRRAAASSRSTRCCRRTTGGTAYNRHYWLEDWPELRAVLLRARCAPTRTPPSSLEDVVGCAKESTGEVMVAGGRRAGSTPTTVEEAEADAARRRLPGARRLRHRGPLPADAGASTPSCG